jgi:cytosolic carboxypeptidase protein 6
MLKCCNIGIVWAARPIGTLCLLALWLGLANAAEAEGIVAGSRPVYKFPSTGITFDATFEGARLSDCILESDGEYRITICPENEPVNNSAWYAFRVSAKSPQTLTIRLTYEGGKHRYHPKISTDGTTWQRLTGDRYRRDKGTVTIQVDVAPEAVWIAAQEMIGVAELNAWTDEVAELPFVEESAIGHSVGDWPIRQLTIGTGTPKYAVAIVGRQHPPEVTGSMALMEFVETIVGSSDLAEQFRQSFRTIVVPLMNPDGVAAGNWRHNLHGVDLNRDWGPFRQPETRAVRDAILPYQKEDTPQLAFFLDFHSTQHDVFYVQTGEEAVWPVAFSNRWLDALATRMPEYKVRREPNTGTRPLSKVWARRTMEVPAVIYEVGDNTDRELIRQVAKTAADAMMRLLLAEVDAVPSDSETPANAALQVQ